MTSRSNKEIGTAFEKLVVDIFKAGGCWVHFLNPDASGAQPFDVIAVKNGQPIAIECKTLADRNRSFPISRLEENQRYAMDCWMRCGNPTPCVAVLYRNKVYAIPYPTLRLFGKIDMESAELFVIGEVKYEDGKTSFTSVSGNPFINSMFYGDVKP